MLKKTSGVAFPIFGPLQPGILKNYDDLLGFYVKHWLRRQILRFGFATVDPKMPKITFSCFVTSPNRVCLSGVLTSI